MRMIPSLFVAALASATLSACVVADDDDDVIVDDGSTMTIANRSSYVLEEVHLAEVGVDTWGPDVLPDVLYPGEDLVITDIRCGYYDVLVVDETGVDCVLGNVDLCVTSDEWIVDDVILDTCAFNPRQTLPKRPQTTDPTATETASPTI